MFASFELPISWRDLLKRTAQKTMKDDAQGLASQLAYYFFLALFPALLCVLAIASFFPLRDLTGQVVRALQPVAPREIIEIIRQQMVKMSESRNGGLLTLGLVGALWTSSSAMVAMIGAMNRAYDIDESRPSWKVRGWAIGLTLALAVFVVAAFTLVVAGPELADAVGRAFGLGSALVWSWKLLQWPIAFALIALGLGFIYYFAPDAEQDWVWLTPGSLVATFLWLAGSLAFRYYVVNFTNYEGTYGAIGGVILLLLWFYLSGLVLVIGAEMNAEIEHASPWGKNPGEKIPGARKKIGVAAARAYRSLRPDVKSRPAMDVRTRPRLTAAPPGLAAKAGAILLAVLWGRREKG